MDGERRGSDAGCEGIHVKSGMTGDSATAEGTVRSHSGTAIRTPREAAWSPAILHSTRPSVGRCRNLNRRHWLVVRTTFLTET